MPSPENLNRNLESEPTKFFWPEDPNPELSPRMTEMLTKVGELIHPELVISLKQTSEQQAQQSLIRRALLLNLDRIATKITEYSHGHPTIRTRQALTEFSTFMGPKLGLTGSLDLTKHVIPNQLEIIYNILKGAYKIELLAKPIKRQRLYQNDLVRMTPERIPDLNLLVQELIVTFDADPIKPPRII